jgi:hypothetical protein
MDWKGEGVKLAVGSRLLAATELKSRLTTFDTLVAATQATQGALATILPDLPAGTRFSVRRSDPTIFPVLGLSLTSISSVGCSSYSWCAACAFGALPSCRSSSSTSWRRSTPRLTW